MGDFALPEISPGAAPEFGDAAGAKAWLENVPLANVAAAQRELLAALRTVNRAAVRPQARLLAMEALREAVHFVQIEQARRFSNRALPLAEAENAVFADTVALWDEMRIGYLRCLDAIVSGEAPIAGEAALVCQRVLAYSGLKMFHYHRAWREVPGSEWRALHRAYAAAERLGVGETAVEDWLNRDVHDTSPRIAYVRAILMGIANPHEMSQRQLTFTAYLLERWAHKVEVRSGPPEREEEPPPVVDLGGERPVVRGDGGAVSEPRWLDTARLAKSLRNRIGLLRKGESPSKLALGEDCVQPSCEQWLLFLYRHWCQQRAPRGAERRRLASSAQCCTGIAAIHFQLSGQVFRQPAERELTREEREQIATFGRLSTRDEDEYGAASGVEPWQIEEESVQGLRLRRPAGAPARRYVTGQLVAVRPADAPGFLLGQVRWLMQAETGDLRAGVRLMPGLPAPVAVRPTGVNVRDEKYVQALALPAVAALGAPPSLVLFPGWFRPNRVLEVFSDSPVRVRLAGALERGADFERVAYEKA